MGAFGHPTDNLAKERTAMTMFTQTQFVQSFRTGSESTFEVVRQSERRSEQQRSRQNRVRKSERSKSSNYYNSMS